MAEKHTITDAAIAGMFSSVPESLLGKMKAKFNLPGNFGLPFGAWSEWGIPAAITLVAWILFARHFGAKLKGDARILVDPVIVFGGSVLWFATIPLLIAGGVFWVLAKLVGKLIGKGKSNIVWDEIKKEDNEG